MFLQHPLDGVLLKLQRAEQHFSDFRSEMRTFRDSKPWSISVEVNAQPGEHVIWAHVHRAIPATWSLLIGDAVHNLRCALDHLIWELSMLCWSSRPDAFPEPDQTVEFPILRYPPTDNKHSFWKKVKSLSPGLVAVIQSLQPYVVSPNEPESHPLWLLNDLDIWDKHKRIALTLATPSLVHFVMYKRSGEAVRGSVNLATIPLAPNSWHPFEDGAKILTVSNSVSNSPNGPFSLDTSIVNVEATVSVEVAFSHGIAAQFKPTEPTVQACVVATRQAVKALEPFFPARR